MADNLIRGLSPDAVARIDEAAAAKGLSRNEYLRRSFDHDLPDDRGQAVSLEDLRRASEAARDLLDENVMRNAWGEAWRPRVVDRQVSVCATRRFS